MLLSFKDKSLKMTKFPDKSFNMKKYENEEVSKL